MCGWINVTTISDSYEVHYDPESSRWRHRPLSMRRERGADRFASMALTTDWIDGRPPTGIHRDGK